MRSKTTILDLPTEIIQDYLFKYLEDTDIYNLSQLGSRRLKEISEGFVQLGKYFNLYHYIKLLSKYKAYKALYIDVLFFQLGPF